MEYTVEILPTQSPACLMSPLGQDSGDGCFFTVVGSPGHASVVCLEYDDDDDDDVTVIHEKNNFSKENEIVFEDNRIENQMQESVENVCWASAVNSTNITDTSRIEKTAISENCEKEAENIDDKITKEIYENNNSKINDKNMNKMNERNTEFSEQFSEDITKTAAEVNGEVLEIKSVSEANEQIKSVSEVNEKIKSVSEVSEQIKSVSEVNEQIKSVSKATEPVKSVSEANEKIKSVSEVSEQIKSVSEANEQIKSASEANEQIKQSAEQSVDHKDEKSETGIYQADEPKRLSSAPKFLRAPSDLEVTAGDDVVFECELTPVTDDLTSVSLQWFKDDDEIPADDQDFVQTFDGRIARLSITDTFIDDSAVYSCVARNEAGQDDVTAKLLVNEVPSSDDDSDVDVKQNNEKHKINKQNEVSDVVSSPISKVLSTSLTDLSTRKRSVMDLLTQPAPPVNKPEHSSKVNLKDKLSPTQDSGRLTLVSNNDNKEHSSLNDSSNIILDGPPAFLVGLLCEKCVQEGKSLVLQCQIGSCKYESYSESTDPSSPTSQQSSYQSPTQTTEKTDKLEKKEPTTLQYIRSRLSTEGKQCDMTSSINKKQDDITLNDVTNNLSTSECDMKTMIMWYKNSELLRSGSEYRQTYKDGVAKLIIKEVYSSDAGTYECVVRNYYGKASTTCKVTIEQPHSSTSSKSIAAEESVTPSKANLHLDIKSSEDRIISRTESLSKDSSMSNPTTPEIGYGERDSKSYGSPKSSGALLTKTISDTPKPTTTPTTSRTSEDNIEISNTPEKQKIMKLNYSVSNGNVNGSPASNTTKREDPLQRRLRLAEEEKQKTLEEYRRRAKGQDLGQGDTQSHSNKEIKTSKTIEGNSGLSPKKDVSLVDLQKRSFSGSVGSGLTAGVNYDGRKQGQGYSHDVKGSNSEAHSKQQEDKKKEVPLLEKLGKSVSVDSDLSHVPRATGLHRSISSVSAVNKYKNSPGGGQRGMDRLVSQLDQLSPTRPHQSTAPRPSPVTRGVTLQRSATTIKQSLLDWCKAVTKDYQYVEISNFTTSWNDGMAFCALIHHFYPQAFDYSQLRPQNRRHNFQLAFDTAEQYGDIAPLLEVDDMVKMTTPDWKCVFTYVQNIYRILTLPRRVIPARRAI